jgi:hypothetical protein
MKTKSKGCGCEMMGKGKGMGGAYGKMEKMLGKKDVEKKGMKEGSKKDMKKDIGIMMSVKMGKTPMKKGGKK